MQGQPISVANANKVCDYFEVQGRDRKFLIDLAARDASRSHLTRTNAAKRLDDSSSRRRYAKLTPSAEYLERWHAGPVAEHLTKFNPTPIDDIATLLDLPVATIKQCMEALDQIGLIKKDVTGKYQKQSDFVLFGADEKPEKLIQDYHRRTLKLASDAIQRQDVTKRSCVTSVLSIDSADMKAAQEEIENFNAKFLDRFGSKPSADRVYFLAVQFFDSKRSSEDSTSF